MVNRIRLPSQKPDAWVRRLKRVFLTENYFDRDYLVCGEATDVIKPDGSLLLKYRPKELNPETCERVKPALRKIGRKLSGRRNFNTGLSGYYFDKGECRLTDFTAKDLNGWIRCLRFIDEVNAVFEEHLFNRYSAQVEACRRTHRDWIIGETAFTTMTVNCWDEKRKGRTYAHTDKGDLPEGFGVISVISSGSYNGGYLIFPKYRVAVDMRTTDVLLCDVHEFHGNAPIDGEPGWERIACILYYRTDMIKCKKPQ